MQIVTISVSWQRRRAAAARAKATAGSVPMRIEPKTFFANERTFLSWLHMAVTIGTIGAALLGFSGAAPRDAHASTAVRLRGCQGLGVRV